MRRAPIMAVAALAATIGLSGAQARASRTVRIDIPAQRLVPALAAFARQSGAELLFSEVTIGARVSPGLKGAFTTEEGLARLLRGSGLVYRRTPRGLFVIVLAPPPPAPPSPDVSDVVALPELMVVGRKTQNADSVRTRDDMLPYQVVQRGEIDLAHAGGVEDLLRARTTINAQRMGPSQNPYAELASPRSEIDLRGLGSDQTLVLVDGRRMPGVARSGQQFLQPDLNAVPIGAVDRVEALTSTAGGIYGPGAMGGVVNLVLARDYSGAALEGAYGITDRGDARYTRLDGRIGASFGEDRLQVMVAASHLDSQPLRFGQRDYAQTLRAMRAANDPSYLPSAPVGAAINVVGFGNLVLKPAYGGQALGSPYTTLPVGLAGDLAGNTDLLSRNAGRTTLALAPDGSGARRGLTSAPSYTSLIANVRVQTPSGLQIYLDIVALDDRGEAAFIQFPQPIVIAPSASSDPFLQPVLVSAPMPTFETIAKTDIQTTRFTTGLIADLWTGWRANLDLALGQARNEARSGGDTISSNGTLAWFTGAGGPAGPAISPLGNWANFQSALDAYRQANSFSLVSKNKFSDATLRLAGPLVTLPAGPLSLSIQAEQRREDSPATQGQTTSGLVGRTINTPYPPMAMRVRSAYLEAHAPIFGDAAPLSLLRDLDLQVAARDDQTRVTMASQFLAFQETGDVVHVGHDDRTYTLAFRTRPTDTVMIRGGLAAGALPPSIADMASSAATVSSPQAGAEDPLRGGRPLGSEGGFVLVTGGSTSLKSAKARSVTLGVVISPSFVPGLKVSLDWTQISRVDEAVASFALADVLARESQLPDRVARLALTPQDAAQGFTGGVVTRLDQTALNIGRSQTRSFDLQVDYQRSFLAVGDLHAHLGVTWQPVFKSQQRPDGPWYDGVGALDGPLEWRSVGSIDWIRGPLTVGLAAQYYDGYRLAYAAPGLSAAHAVLVQGGDHIPGQAYVDAAIAYALHRGLFARGGQELRLGVRNVLDKRPPTDASSDDYGYSYFGDPRRRRVELTLIQRF